MRRVFDLDVLACPRCGGRLRIIASGGARATAFALPPDLRGLVVEDEPALADMLREFVQGKGCRVTLADGGRAALEQARYDVVLTDLLLPWASGWEIARAAKRRAPGSRLILMSGKMVPEEIWAAEGTVDASLTKPHDLGKLLDLIAQLVGDRAE